MSRVVVAQVRGVDDMIPTAQTTDYHIARLLVLLLAFSPRGGTFDGLTKLAKLDFLLRYPVFLERLMDARELAWPTGLAPDQSERWAVESHMIRYKYGPWDDRYYVLLGGLVGRGLAELVPAKRTISLRLTPEGRALAESVGATVEWSVLAARSAFLKRHFDWTGNRLKETIYRELPDVVQLPLRTKIAFDGSVEPRSDDFEVGGGDSSGGPT
jgi:hypothetical protein